MTCRECDSLPGESAATGRPRSKIPANQQMRRRPVDEILQSQLEHAAMIAEKASEAALRSLRRLMRLRFSSGAVTQRRCSLSSDD